MVDESKLLFKLGVGLQIVEDVLVYLISLMFKWRGKPCPIPFKWRLLGAVRLDVWNIESSHCACCGEDGWTKLACLFFCVGAYCVPARTEKLLPVHTQLIPKPQKGQRQNEHTGCPTIKDQLNTDINCSTPNQKNMPRQLRPNHEQFDRWQPICIEGPRLLMGPEWLEVPAGGFKQHGW